jgi:hypothetical protein
VEKQLDALGTVPVLRSVFVRDSDIDAISAMLAEGPLVGRCSTGSGGSGVFPFATVEEYCERIPKHPDGFVGLTPLLEGAAPLNVNACVYRTGEVAVFGVSYQLIGVRGLTRRAFGFSGNDFGIAAQLAPEVCDDIETAAVAVGRWLHQFGYRGVFGLDVMFYKGDLYVSEINPRFQASTPLSASINQALDYPDPMTEHVAAYLDLPAPRRISTAEQTHACGEVFRQMPVAQVVHRNISTGRLRTAEIHADRLPDDIRIVGVPAPGIYVDREAMLFKSLHSVPVTQDGYSVSEAVNEAKSAVTIAEY